MEPDCQELRESGEHATEVEVGKGKGNMTNATLVLFREEHRRSGVSVSEH